MPYKCVHCSALYADGASELLNGCTSCHSKFFFYIRPEKLVEIQQQAKALQETSIELTQEDKEQIERDVRDIVGLNESNEQTPVFLDFESIKVLTPGKYLLDLPKLLAKTKPRVYQLEDGKYIVDLSGKLQ